MRKAYMQDRPAFLDVTFSKRALRLRFRFQHAFLRPAVTGIEGVFERFFALASSDRQTSLRRDCAGSALTTYRVFVFKTVLLYAAVFLRRG